MGMLAYDPARRLTMPQASGAQAWRSSAQLSAAQRSMMGTLAYDPAGRLTMQQASAAGHSMAQQATSIHQELIQTPHQLTGKPSTNQPNQPNQIS